MSETTELKPCPFCNSGRIGMDDVGGNVYFVICPDCDAYGPNSNTEEGAAFKWNNPVPSALAARVEALEAANEALLGGLTRMYAYLSDVKTVDYAIAREELLIIADATLCGMPATNGGEK